MSKTKKKQDKSANGHEKPGHLDKKVIIILAVILVIFATSIIFALSQMTVKETLSYEESFSGITEYIDDDTLELGTSEIERAGVDGLQTVYYEVEKKLIGGEEVARTQLRIDITKSPISEIVRQGTRKWQYMYCSDGGYMYFTDEQFSDKNTGYTHASEDGCAKNGRGHMTELADTPPAKAIQKDTASASSSSTNDAKREVQDLAMGYIEDATACMEELKTQDLPRSTYDKKYSECMESKGQTGIYKYDEAPAWVKNVLNMP